MSCVVGARDGGGTGASLEKPFIDHRSIWFSFADLEKMRSPWKATLGGY